MNILNIVRQKQQKAQAIKQAQLVMTKRNTCYLIKR